jgi:hypothetical protein
MKIDKGRDGKHEQDRDQHRGTLVTFYLTGNVFALDIDQRTRDVSFTLLNVMGLKIHLVGTPAPISYQQR